MIGVPTRRAAVVLSISISIVLALPLTADVAVAQHPRGGSARQAAEAGATTGNAATRDSRAELREGRGHPAHGATGKRGIADAAGHQRG